MIINFVPIICVRSRQVWGMISWEERSQLVKFLCHGEAN